MPRIIVEETESGSHFNIDISGRLDHITVHDLVEQLRINAAILPNDIDRYYLCFQDEEHKYRPYRDEGTLQENGISEGLTVYLRKGDNQKLVGIDQPLRLLGEKLDRLIAPDHPANVPRVLFVCGEPGIGKSILVNEFLSKAERRSDLRHIVRINWKNIKDSDDYRLASYESGKLAAQDVLRAFVLQLQRRLDSLNLVHFEQAWLRFLKVEEIVGRELGRLYSTPASPFEFLKGLTPSQLRASLASSNQESREKVQAFLNLCFQDEDPQLIDAFYTTQYLELALSRDLNAFSESVLICFDEYDSVRNEKVERAFWEIITSVRTPFLWLIVHRENLLGGRYPSQFSRQRLEDPVELDCLSREAIVQYLEARLPFFIDWDDDLVRLVMERTRGIPLQLAEETRFFEKYRENMNLVYQDPGYLRLPVKVRMERTLQNCSPIEQDVVYLLALMRSVDTEIVDGIFQDRQILASLTNRFLFVLPDGRIHPRYLADLRTYLMSTDGSKKRKQICRLAIQELTKRILLMQQSEPLYRCWQSRPFQEYILERVNLELLQAYGSGAVEEDRAWGMILKDFMQAVTYAVQEVGEEILGILTQQQNLLPFEKRRLFKMLRIRAAPPRGRRQQQSGQEEFTAEIARIFENVRFDPDPVQPTLHAILSREQAYLFFLKGEYLPALRSFRHAEKVLFDPENSRMVREFAEHYFELGVSIADGETEDPAALSEALAAVQHVDQIGIPRTRKRHELCFLKAKLYFRLGRLKEAIQSTEEAALENGRSDLYQEFLAELHMEAGDLNRAVQTLASAPSAGRSASGRELAIRIIVRYYKAGQYAAAIDVFDRFCANEAVDARLLNLIGNCYYHRSRGSRPPSKDLAAARRCYQAAMKVAPKDAHIRANHANVLQLMEKFVMSRTQYRIAASCSSSWYYPALQFGNLLLSESARLAVDDTPVRLNDAAEHYRWVLQRHPGNLQALLGMAVIRFEQGNRVESQQYMDGIAGSNAAFVHYVRGRLALGRGEDRDAKRAFLNCTKAATYHLRGLYYLAETCFRLNALDESRVACEKVLELNPDFAPALFLLAECSLRGGRAAEAQKYLARYLADPQQLRQAGLPEGRFHSLAARVSYFQSDLVSALQFYEMASGSRADPELEFEIGCVHFAMQDYEQAAARFRHAQRAGHWPENLLDLTALTQLGQGQAGRALKSFERALETSPDDMLASLGAGALALQAGKTAVSQQHFQSAIEQYGNIKVLPGAGDRCLYKLVQLGLSIGSMIQPDELENNLQAVRKLVGIHYLQAMKMIVNIMIESGLSTAALLREYKGILNRVIGNMSFGQLA